MASRELVETDADEGGIEVDTVEQRVNLDGSVAGKVRCYCHRLLTGVPQTAWCNAVKINRCGIRNECRMIAYDKMHYDVIKGSLFVRSGDRRTPHEMHREVWWLE